MSADSSPVVAALKSRLEKQGLTQDGQNQKGSPSTPEKSPGIGTKVKPLPKPEVWGGSKSPGVSAAKPKPGPLLPSQTGKTGSPGLIREGWQPKGKNSPPQKRSALEAKSTLAKVLQSRPDFVRTQEKQSPPMPPSKKIGNSLESSNSDDEESCFIDSAKKRSTSVICRGSVSSPDSDVCEIGGQEVYQLPGATRSREGELVSSRSEENIATLTVGGVKYGRTSSVLSADNDTKRKPLPGLPTSTQNLSKPLSVVDKAKSASTSNPKAGSATPPAPQGSKPHVPKSKPALPTGKPTVTRNKDTSPSHSLKPKPPANKPKPGTPKLVSKAPTSSPKPIENRQKPLVPSNNVLRKPGVSSKPALSSSVDKKTCMLPPNKPSKPLHLGSHQQNGTVRNSTDRRSLAERRSSSPEELSMDSHEVILAIMNTPDEDMLNSDSTPPKKVPKKEDLEDTLTNSQTRDLESTLVRAVDGPSNEWVMVRQKKQEEERAKVERNTWSGGDATTGIGVVNKKLPSTPEKSRTLQPTSPSSGSPKMNRISQPPSTTTKETHSEPSSPYNSTRPGKSSKINALMDKFSGQSATPPPPCRVYGKNAAAADVPDNKPKPPSKPSVGVVKGEAHPSNGPSTAPSNPIVSGKWFEGERKF